MIRPSAGGSVPVTVGFPVVAVPGSAVSAVICSLWSAAAGRSRFPTSYPVLRWWRVSPFIAHASGVINPNVRLRGEFFTRSQSRSGESQIPPAKPEAWRALAPQRGLTAHGGPIRSNVGTPLRAVRALRYIVSFLGKNTLPELSNSGSPPAEPGVSLSEMSPYLAGVHTLGGPEGRPSHLETCLAEPQKRARRRSLNAWKTVIHPGGAS